LPLLKIIQPNSLLLLTLEINKIIHKKKKLKLMLKHQFPPNKLMMIKRRKLKRMTKKMSKKMTLKMTRKIMPDQLPQPINKIQQKHLPIKLKNQPK